MAAARMAGWSPDAAEVGVPRWGRKGGLWLEEGKGDEPTSNVSGLGAGSPRAAGLGEERPQSSSGQL